MSPNVPLPRVHVGVACQRQEHACGHVGHKQQPRCPSFGWVVEHNRAKLVVALSNPSGKFDMVQQRDLLRVVYESFDLESIEACIRHNMSAIDSTTAVDVLCYISDHYKTSQLIVEDVEACDGLVELLCGCIDLKEICQQPQVFAALIWSLETLPQQSSEWRKDIIVSVSMMELEKGSVQHYSTREVLNLILSLGNIVEFSSTIDRRVMRYVEMLMVELISRLEKPHVRSAFGGAEFADLAGAGVSLFGACLPNNVHTQGNMQGQKASYDFLAALSRETRRKLSNRHSSARTFTAHDLKRFLFSYVKLHMVGGDAVIPLQEPDMLDQVASHVSQSIKNTDAVAIVNTIDDLAAILEFFAFFSRKSVAVMDLFSSAGMQLRLLSEDPSQEDGLDWMGALASILECHIRMGFSPTEVTLLSLLPAIRYHKSGSSDKDRQSILNAFEMLQFDCGAAFRHDMNFL